MRFHVGGETGTNQVVPRKHNNDVESIYWMSLSDEGDLCDSGALGGLTFQKINTTVAAIITEIII